MKNATRADLSKYKFRPAADGTWQIKRKQSVLEYSNFTIEDITKIARDSGWQEVTFEVEKEWSYGDEYARLNMSGWDTATIAELAEAVEKVNDERKRQATWQEKQAADLKKSRPDLFQ